MPKHKHYIAVLLLSAALCGCSSENSDKAFSSETAASAENTSISEEIHDETSVQNENLSETKASEESISESEAESEERSELEEKIIKAAGLEAVSAYPAIYPSFSGDFDSDGADELFAVCGTGGTLGTLWYANAEEAWNIYPAQNEWGGFRTAEAGGDTLILIEEIYPADSATRCFRVEDSLPIGIDTFGTGFLAQTGETEFTGMKKAYDRFSDGTGRTAKPYWFYYENGALNEYTARLIPYESFKDGFIGAFEEYACLKPFFDGIEAENGDISNIIVRDNGVVNINYEIAVEAVNGQDFFAERFFRTLLVNNGTVTDITPEENYGSYEVWAA